MNERQKTLTIPVRIEPEQGKRLDKAKEDVGLSKAFLIRLGIDWALDQVESGKIEIKSAKNP